MIVSWWINTPTKFSPCISTLSMCTTSKLPWVWTAWQTWDIWWHPPQSTHGPLTPHSCCVNPLFSWQWHSLSPTYTKSFFHTCCNKFFKPKNKRHILKWNFDRNSHICHSSDNQYLLLCLRNQIKRGNFNNTADCYTSLHSSTRIKKRSNLDMMGAVNVIFCFRDFVLSYLPPIGLAAAKMDVLAFKVA